MNRFRSSDLARRLGIPLIGEDEELERADDVHNCGPGGVVWIRSGSPALVEAVNRQRPSLVICDAESAPWVAVPHLLAPNPRLAFIRVLQAFFAPPMEEGIHPTAVIHSGAQLGRGVSVGAYARIGPQVALGEGTSIGSGVAIEGRVTLGRDCRVKPNAVLGAHGFGFEWDEDGKPVHFPHIGSVEIGDEVWIGSCSTVERAGLGATRILRGVKIDDHVQVGHNCVIGENALIMANVVVCGGASIGPGCWIAPNSVVKQKTHVGEGATVGLGSVVLKDVDPQAVVAGVPARRLH